MLIVNIWIVKITFKLIKTISIELISWDVLNDKIYNCTTLSLGFHVFFDEVMSFNESNVLVIIFHKYMYLRWSLSENHQLYHYI